MTKHQNGRLPASALRSLSTSPNRKLTRANSFIFDAISRLYKVEFGHYISVTDSYRDYAEQVAVKKAKGWLAATPGTSNHGWGKAVDLGGGINVFGSKQRKWLEKFGPKLGLISPAWAQKNGAKPEPWHWEFVFKTRAYTLRRDTNQRYTPNGKIASVGKAGKRVSIIIGSDIKKGGYTWVLATNGRWYATSQLK